MYRDARERRDASASGEFGFSLLEERADAFPVVLGLKKRVERLADPPAECRPIGIEGSPEAVLDGPDGKRRVRRDSACQGPRCRDEFIMRHHPAGQSGAASLGSVDDVAGHQEFRCLLPADELSQAA